MKREPSTAEEVRSSNAAALNLEESHMEGPDQCIALVERDDTRSADDHPARHEQQKEHMSTQSDEHSTLFCHAEVGLKSKQPVTAHSRRRRRQKNRIRAAKRERERLAESQTVSRFSSEPSTLSTYSQIRGRISAQTLILKWIRDDGSGRGFLPPG